MQPATGAPEASKILLVHFNINTHIAFHQVLCFIFNFISKMLCNTKLEVAFGMFSTLSVPESDYLWLFAFFIYFIPFYFPVAGVCDIPPVRCLHNPEVVGFGLHSCPVVSVLSMAVCTATLQIVETLQRRTDKLLVHLKYVWWLVLICIIT